MTFISEIAREELLCDVPDFTLWDEARAWIDEQKAYHPKDLQNVRITSLEWKNPPEDGYFGYYQEPLWRKFVLAVFAADLVSYEEADDQVSFERLLFVMHGFPQGFRVWWMQTDDTKWRPIGYTGWYPMSETSFLLFKNSPEKIQNRCVVPSPKEPYLYLFNFSVAPYLKVKALTKPLMEGFIDDIKKQNPEGIACITVSDDGIRQATRLGMKSTCKGIYSADLK